MSTDVVASKRRRLAKASFEKDKGGVRDSSRLSALPTQVLGNCFSFLGPSGHYYFLASVCKDFKVAVEELYGDDRNTSVGSILTSISTCRHVMEMTSGEEYEQIIQEKITNAVFSSQRIDIFQHVFRPSLIFSDIPFLLGVMVVIVTLDTRNLKYK